MPVASLREVQQLFWDSLAGAPVSIAPGLADAVVPGAALDSRERLGIYADAYASRLLDVLREDFPRVAALLGDHRFEHLAREYLARHPSEHPSVRHLGHGMAPFLERRSDVPRFVAELASLEWARVEVFDAPDATPLAMDHLRAIDARDWPHLHFVPVPALRLVRASWPVHELWAGADPARLAPATTVIRVWRDASGAAYHAPLDARAAEVLRLLIAGAPFVIACEAFTDRTPLEAAQAITALLARWIEDGIIARIG